MKNYDRVLAMLLAVLLLIGAMTAYAEGDVDLVVSQDIEVPQDIDGLDLTAIAEQIMLPAGE